MAREAIGYRPSEIVLPDDYLEKLGKYKESFSYFQRRWTNDDNKDAKWEHEIIAILGDTKIDPSDRVKNALALPWFNENNGFNHYDYEDYPFFKIREEKPVIIDLRGISAYEEKINNCHLISVNLDFSYLHFCELKDCDLMWSSCRFADFRNSTFPGTRLYQAQFIGTNLDGADLKEKDFGGPASFSYATLRSANLKGCLFNGTDFNGTDFTNASAKNAQFNVVKFKNPPMVVGFDVRGSDFSGAPDFLLYLRDELANRATTDSIDIFVCHDSRDKHSFVRPLVEKLCERKIQVWYDEYTLKPGDSLLENIDRGLKQAKYAVMVISHNFLKNDGWTKKEFRSLFTRELTEGRKLVVPIWVDVDTKDVANYSLDLADRLAITINGKPDFGFIADQIIRTVRPSLAGYPETDEIYDANKRVNSSRKRK
ncbi:MAG: toll/interleukin-1 receptor domain-containing protein [Bacteroidales bacterium]|nr:toll/interleukin-1 receptor domain-containing protein [Bacteroidales bacterium]